MKSLSKCMTPAARLPMFMTVTLKINFKIISSQWPNLKNLSGGLNLSRGLNMLGST